MSPIRRVCACQMSQSFLGKQIDGVWHTGVVVFGKEFFFGGGIQDDVPGRTPYGVPVQRIPLGDSHIPHEVFVEFLQEISSRFSMESCKCLARCVLLLCCLSMYRFGLTNRLHAWQMISCTTIATTSPTNALSSSRVPPSPNTSRRCPAKC